MASKWCEMDFATIHGMKLAEPKAGGPPALDARLGKRGEGQEAVRQAHQALDAGAKKKERKSWQDPCSSYMNHTKQTRFTLPPTNMEVQNALSKRKVVFLQGSVHLAGGRVVAWLLVLTV